MAKSDISVKLGLNSKEFDDNIKNSQKQINKFRESTNNQGNQIQSSLGNVTKMAGKMFAAFMAFDKLKDFGKDLVNSSQKTGDAFANNMNAAKSSYDAFCAALATSDFSAFENGLIGVFNRAKELSALLDSIADAQKAVAYSSSQNAVELQRNENIAKDKSKSKEERQKALERNREIIKKEGEDRLRVADENRNAAMQNARLSGVSLNNLNKDDVGYYLGTLNNDFANEEFVRQYKFIDDYVKKRKDAWDKIINYENRNGGMIDAKKRDEFNNKWMTPDEAMNKEFGKNQIFSGSKTLEFGKLYNQGDKGRDILYNAFTGYQKELLWIEQQVGTLVTLNNRINNINNEGKTQVSGKDATPNTPIPDYQFDAGLHINPTTEWDRLQKQIDLQDSLNWKVELDGEEEAGDSFAFSPLTDVKNIDVNDQINQFTNLATAIGSVTGAVNEGASGWISWGASLLTAIATAIPAISALTAAKKAEANANAEAAVTGAAASVSGIPVVGWLMAGAAVASVIAAMVSIPKFASGGVVGGGSYNGDKIPALLNAGEMVLNDRQQTNLFNQLNSGSGRGGNVNVTGELKLSGSDLIAAVKKNEKLNDRI